MKVIILVKGSVITRKQNSKLYRYHIRLCVLCSSKTKINLLSFFELDVFILKCEYYQLLINLIDASTSSTYHLFNPSLFQTILHRCTTQGSVIRRQESGKKDDFKLKIKILFSGHLMGLSVNKDTLCAPDSPHIWAPLCSF